MPASVSVIIPTYNRIAHLVKAIDSVLAQSYRNFEIIVVDDGSDDGTQEIVASYGHPVSYIHQPNRGVSAARNAGVKGAKYSFLAFLDSDDRYEPDKLKIQVEALESSPEHLISHTDEVWYRQGKILSQKKKHARSGGDIFERSLELCVVGMSTVMVRREFFDLVGLFDESLPCCEDYDLWLRAGCRYPFLLVPKPLTIKDGGRPDQLSAIHREGMDKYRIQSLVKLLESALLSVRQTELASEELCRKCTVYGNGCLKHGREEEGRAFLKLASEYRAPSLI
ncbi:MAG: glycosyltransferase [Proteobacteria bacterium]|nr:glycosyltransferase [Pseudomonadota bacterium]MBU1739600.1 glycosyltransferase [Pseudomonadota bacterium]